MTAEPEPTAQSGEIEAYLAELSAALDERGVDTRRAQRAIGHLEHGLVGRSTTPVGLYGPVEQLADAMIEAFSTKRELLWRAIAVVGGIAFYLLIGLSVTNPASTQLQVLEDGTDKWLAFSSGDRVFPRFWLLSALTHPLIFVGRRVGGGYLLPSSGSKLNYGGREGFGRRPPLRLRRAIGPLCLGAVAFVAFQIVTTRFVPPNFGNDYLVSQGTLWIVGMFSVTLMGLCAWAYLRHLRVPVAGDVGYLLRDSGDMLHNAPGRRVAFGDIDTMWTDFLGRPCSPANSGSEAKR